MLHVGLMLVSIIVYLLSQRNQAYQLLLLLNKINASIIFWIKNYPFRLHKNLVNMIYEASPFALFIHFSNVLIEYFRIDFRKYLKAFAWYIKFLVNTKVSYEMNQLWNGGDSLKKYPIIILYAYNHSNKHRFFMFSQTVL